MRGELTPIEGREVIRHLVRGCSQCREVTRTLWTLGERGGRSAAAALFARGLAPSSAPEDLQAQARARFAEGMSEARQGRVAEADRALLAAEREFLALG